MESLNITDTVRSSELWTRTSSNDPHCVYHVSVDRMSKDMSVDAQKEYASNMDKLKHSSVIELICSDEEKKLMVFQKYSESLEGGLQRHKVDHFFELNNFHNGQLYSLAPRSKNMLKKLLKGLEFLYRKNMSYQELSTRSVVFKDGDEGYEEPLFIDLFDLQDNAPPTHLWKKLADLIKHMIEYYKIEDKVSPDVECLLHQLRRRGWTSAEKLKKHPALLDKAGKLKKIIQIRDKIHDNVCIDIRPDFSAKVCEGFDWISFLKRVKNPYLDLMLAYRVQNPYRNDCNDLLDLIRNMSEHLNENVKAYNHNNGRKWLKELTKVEKEALIEHIFPALASHLFNRVDATNWLK
ncbi:hypothetical protein ACHQM5_008723 [Ranunculus cassubicifolius]